MGGSGIESRREGIGENNPGAFEGIESTESVERIESMGELKVSKASKAAGGVKV